MQSRQQSKRVQANLCQCGSFAYDLRRFWGLVVGYVGRICTIDNTLKVQGNGLCGTSKNITTGHCNDCPRPRCFTKRSDGSRRIRFLLIDKDELKRNRSIPLQIGDHAYSFDSNRRTWRPLLVIRCCIHHPNPVSVVAIQYLCHGSFESRIRQLQADKLSGFIYYGFIDLKVSPFAWFACPQLPLPCGGGWHSLGIGEVDFHTSARIHSVVEAYKYCVNNLNTIVR